MKFYNTEVPGGGYTGDFLDARWYLVDLSNLNDTIYSENTIRVANEQIIPEYGISVQIGQYELDIVNRNAINLAYYPALLSSGIEYPSNTPAFLGGVPDSDGNSFFNWIRSGIVTEDEEGTQPCFILDDGSVDRSSRIELSEESAQAIRVCRTFLDEKLRSGEEVIYGINTGFGSLCDTRIGTESLHQLQRNLVMSHACGTGDEVPAELVKLMLLLKVQSLSYGYSAVDLLTIERLIWHYNAEVLPVIYQQGSLGASGDLAPLAHLSLPLIGLGEVRVKGEVLASSEILKKHGLSALILQSKEGLALLNGTQFMSAYGAYICITARRLFRLANLIAAVSIEAYDCMADRSNR